MKKNIVVIIFIAALIAACGTPSTPIVSNPPPVVQPATEIPTATFTPVATFTPQVLPTQGFPTFVPPTAAPAGQPNVIQFPAGGTYVDITDTIPFGSSKTYSLNAMKGQMMSISTLPVFDTQDWAYIPMQIQGADGSVLCPSSADTDCYFWRGALPASQDYYLILTPNRDIPKFVMRVAINPPGKESQTFQYYNQNSKLSLTYSDSFAPALPVISNYKTYPELALHLVDTASYEKTNLGEAYLFFSSSSDAQTVATCTDPNQNGGAAEQVIGNETVNGYTFVHSNAVGVGAGNIYDQEIYRMVNSGICYEVIYYMHSGNIGNYTPGSVNEFDRNAIVQKFYSVFATFTLK